MTDWIRHPRLFICLAILITLGVFAAACVQLAPRVLPSLNPSTTGAADDVPMDADTPTVQVPALSSTANANRNLSAVRRGTIARVLNLTGRVTGAGETPLAFSGSGKVQSVMAKLGDAVVDGQVLLQIDAQEVDRQLKTAQAALESASIRYDQAKAQMAADASARQRDAADRQRNDATQRQAISLDAEAALHRAQDELARVQAGASDNDIRAAQAAVTDAQVASQRAESALLHLYSGPDPAVIRQDQRDVDDAQTNVDRAQQALDTLTRGPAPDAVRAAERDVQRAQNQLRVAQAIKVDAKSTEKERAERDAAITASQLDVQDMQDRLARLKEPPVDAEVSIARRNIEVARSKLDAARQHLDADRRPPDQDAIDQLTAQIDNAHLAQQSAEQRLAELQSHPTSDELRAARDKVAAAQAALSRANQLGTGPAVGGADANQVAASYNLVLLEKEIARDQALVDSLQHDLDAARMTAPAAGVISSVQVRPGDALNAGSIVFSLAEPRPPVVQADVAGKDADVLHVGQRATFKADGSNGEPRAASITALKTPAPGRSIAEISVDWGQQTAGFGATGQLQVTTQQKENVLLVPKKALRAAGTRRYVQVQDGTARRIVNVEAGITSGDDVEVVSGLSEGQLVYVLP